MGRKRHCVTLELTPSDRCCKDEHTCSNGSAGGLEVWTLHGRCTVNSIPERCGCFKNIPILVVCVRGILVPHVNDAKHCAPFVRHDCGKIPVASVLTSAVSITCTLAMPS